MIQDSHSTSSGQAGFKIKQTSLGSISILVLLLGMVAAMAVGALIMVTVGQVEYARRQVIGEQALGVAESGINYYRWHLAHSPKEFTADTGEHAYNDPGGVKQGTFNIEVTPPPSGSTVVTVASTGWLNDNPDIKRKVVATYGIPALTQYAMLNNSNVWFGQGMTVDGPVMTNGGIRQDGANNSTLSTSKATYTCGVETGCEPAETKPGIWGKGGPAELWQFPVSNVDFANIRIDFDTMAKAASGSAGLYLANSGKQGYHIVFLDDGTFKVYRVETTDFYPGWSQDYGCQNLYQNIKKETLLNTYNVADKPIIFAQDTLWVNGVVKGKTTVVAAQMPVESFPRDIWIPDNLVYLDRSGANQLGLIASRDIIFAKDVPKDFEVNGALLAQSSRVLRHHYNYDGCKDGNPANKNLLTIYGSVISNLMSYWNYSGGGGEAPTSRVCKAGYYL